MMMSFLPEGRPIGFMPNGDKRSEGGFLLPSSQASSLSSWFEVDSNLRPSGYRAQNTSVPLITKTAINSPKLAAALELGLVPLDIEFAPS